MSKNKALMATVLIDCLTRLVEQHGDLPGHGGYGAHPDDPVAPESHAGGQGRACGDHVRVSSEAPE